MNSRKTALKGGEPKPIMRPKNSHNGDRFAAAARLYLPGSGRRSQCAAAFRSLLVPCVSPICYELPSCCRACLWRDFDSVTARVRRWPDLARVCGFQATVRRHGAGAWRSLFTLGGVAVESLRRMRSGIQQVSRGTPKPGRKTQVVGPAEGG